MPKIFIFLLSLLWSAALTSPLEMNGVLAADETPATSANPAAFEELTPAREYAGELLAYLLKVVLGRAGQADYKKQWRNRGLREELDFGGVYHVMTDLNEDQLRLMVLDPNILPLTEVLYHYDEKLSLHKGNYGVTGIYPAPEIVGIRLFLLKKMHAGEKMDLDAFMAREKCLLNPDYKPGPEDLAATLLRPREMQFLRDIFTREPGTYPYLTCPFLVKTIVETGAVQPRGRVREIIARARYDKNDTDPQKSRPKSQKPDICILTSMTKEFVFDPSHGSLSKYGFRATPFLKKTWRKLKKQILEATHKKLELPIQNSLDTSTKPLEWQRFSTRNIRFHIVDDRPLVIYPENAARRCREVCPGADITIILLGKNTYRALDLDPLKDAYPAKPVIYLDIMDVQYDMAKEEIDGVAGFIAAHLEKSFAEMVANP